jgi:hypothetical protein
MGGNVAGFRLPVAALVLLHLFRHVVVAEVAENVRARRMRRRDSLIGRCSSARGMRKPFPKYPQRSVSSQRMSTMEPGTSPGIGMLGE